ncbi:MAG: cupin domain-containing protein [Hyphomonadaceae bacterium]|jgi:uncharacterized cupin superfamily protein
MRVILFRDSAEPVEPWQPEPDRVVVTGAKGGTQNLYESGDGRVYAGVWHATCGAWRVVYDEMEYCHITKGRARLTALNGEVTEVQAGDGFVIPNGFEGVWDVLEDMEKHYVIVLPLQL